MRIEYNKDRPPNMIGRDEKWIQEQIAIQKANGLYIGETGRVYYSEERKAKKDVITQATLKSVKAVLSTMDYSKLDSVQIAEILNDKGAYTANNQPWKPSNLATFLRKHDIRLEVK